ncbi:MAG: hypothetical protein AAFX79_04075 [Planctomycetota bacterium]
MKKIGLCSETRSTPGLASCRIARIALLLSAAALASCAADPQPTRPIGSFADLTDAPETARDQDAWTVAMAAFRGPRAQELAQATLARATAEGGLRGARLEPRNEAILLAFGRFAGPDDREAQAALERVRGAQIGGVRPFAAAVLAPPEPPTGSVAEYDLTNVASYYGPGFDYTLQIGAYGRNDGRPPSPSDRRSAREAAEEAVAILRSEGELAFYYHGPNFSHVTVGLFNADEFDAQNGVFPPAFLDLQRKFPVDRINGQERRVRRPGQREARAVQTFLIAIPAS